jgi:hypothetical protein
MAAGRKVKIKIEVGKIWNEAGRNWVELHINTDTNNKDKEQKKFLFCSGDSMSLDCYPSMERAKEIGRN